MAELRSTIKQRDGHNSALDEDLKELNVAVNERRHIDEVNGKLFLHCHRSCTVYQSSSIDSADNCIFQLYTLVLLNVRLWLQQQLFLFLLFLSVLMHYQ